MPHRAVAGHVLGHYHILELLGAGGMGEVYRAHDERLDRDVALKVLPEESAADRTANGRLLREARTASQLNHPNICTIYEVGEEEGRSFIAMELIAGETLRARLQHGPLPADLLLNYAAQLADALAHAHQQGIVHRDLKTGNVMITAADRVKVLDFGLAKRTSQADLDAATRSGMFLTETGTVVGTLTYMAPEQLRGHPADARSDVWAIGVVLHEMTAGSLPFRGRTAFEMSSSILHDSAAPLPPGTSPELLAVIERCLDKEPVRRFQNGGELSAAIQAIQSGAVTRKKTSGGSVRRRRRIISLAAAMAALTVFAVASFGRWRPLLSPAPRIQSLAVLPLANLSGDPQQEYFADGMTEALITDLGRLKALKRIVARGSVTRYKGTSKSLGEIARELNVDALVTGAVVRSGSAVALTAQLIDPRTEQEIWARRYERDVRDIVRLQSELTSTIAGEIRLTLAPEEQARLSAARTVNPEAYDAYLQGRFHWQKRSRQELDIAEKYFERGIEKDPSYALAYTGLSIVWGLRCATGLSPCKETMPKYKATALQAVALDPSLPEAHAVLAGVRFYNDRDWDAAEKELRNAIELDPKYPEVHIWYSEFLANVRKRPAEALAEVQQVVDLDPQNSYYQAWMGEALLRARRYDEAIDLFRRLIRQEPDLRVVRNDLQDTLERKGMYKEAMEVWRDNLSRGDARDVLDAIERGYAEGGYQGAMRARAELAVRRAEKTFVSPLSIARFYTAAGEQELALDWLEKAYEDHQALLVRLGAWPEWDVLRGHPRFKGLLERLKLD